MRHLAPVFSLFDGIDKLQHFVWRFLDPTCFPAVETPKRLEPLVRGEVVGDAQISSDRYRVIAGAKMLMATPEMMWSTLKRVTAVQWISPPSIPPRIANRTPT